MTEELKPCPFCGCEVCERHMEHYAGLNFNILCVKCKVVMKSKLRDDLIERWNTRVIL